MKFVPECFRDRSSDSRITEMKIFCLEDSIVFALIKSFLPYKALLYKGV